MSFWKKFLLSATGAAAITAGFGAWETSIDDQRERERMQLEFRLEQDKLAQEAANKRAEIDREKSHICASVLTDDAHSPDLDKERFNRYVDYLCEDASTQEFNGKMRNE